MTTSTLALDGTSYRFLGYGTSLPVYEKGNPLANTFADLSSAAQDSLIDDCLALFSWARVHVVGGEHYRENAGGTRNYPAKKQAPLLAYINQRGGPYRYIVTPFAAPSSIMTNGFQTTERLTAGAGYGAAQDVDDTTADWQVYKDAVAAALNVLMLSGCDIRIISHPNECANESIPNYWSCRLTDAQYPNYIHKVWLGTVLSGGSGIKDEFPWLSFQAGDPGDGATYTRNSTRTALFADSTATAECAYYDAHIYEEDALDAAKQKLLGIATDTDVWGKCIVGEFGCYVAGETITLTECKTVSRIAHAALVYGKAPVACVFAPLRDITEKLIAAPNGVVFTAKPLADLTTGSNSYAFTKLWYALKPYLIACGKGEADVLCMSSRTTTDAHMDPATGVYVTHFLRADGAECTVYANFSGASRSDTISYTVSASPHDMSGNKTTYSCNTTSEADNGAVSTSSGSITLSSVANGETVLLEWTA